jgi:hypothetical protein
MGAVDRENVCARSGVKIARNYLNPALPSRLRRRVDRLVETHIVEIVGLSCAEAFT